MYIRYHYLFPVELSSTLFTQCIYRDDTSVVFLENEAPQSIMDCSVAERINTEDLLRLERAKAAGLVISSSILDAFGYTQSNESTGC